MHLLARSAAPLLRHSTSSLNCSPLIAAKLNRRSMFTDPSLIFNLQAGKTLLVSVISLNVAVFGCWKIAENRSPPSYRLVDAARDRYNRLERFLENKFLLSTATVRKSRFYEPLLGSAFSHREPYHLLGNMFSLYAFGSVLLYSSGLTPWTLGSLLFSSALSGSLGYLLQAQQVEKNPRAPRRSALGASGMVMGLGTAAALYNPYAQLLLFGLIPAPCAVLVGGYVVYDTFFVNDPMSRVGHAAHLGGALNGALFYFFFLRRLGGFV